jgi:hypothetical protein
LIEEKCEMMHLRNDDGIVEVGFDFLENLPEDFDSTEDLFEKWVPFVLVLTAPTASIAITENMQAALTVHEIGRVYNGLKSLLDCVGGDEDKEFSHYSNGAYFEIKFEYYYIDECFSFELWFVEADYPKGMFVGYDVGFRFSVEVSEVAQFADAYYERFKVVCPQYPLEGVGVGEVTAKEHRN